MNDDLRRRLEDAGERPVPAIDPGFADALEQRLLAVASSVSPGGAAPLQPPPPKHRGPLVAWLLTGLGAAVVVAVLMVVVGPLRPVPAPTPGQVAALVEPVHVEVVMPDGEVLEDPDGLLLPAGAVITVGEGGYARIGETVLGPGDIATIDDGRVVVEHPTQAGVVEQPTPAATPRPTRRPSEHTPKPSASPAGSSTVSPSPSPTLTASPTDEPKPTPQPTAEPTRAPVTTSRPADSQTEPPAATPTPTPKPPILRPRLRARLITGPRIAVTWTETLHAKRYVLLVTLSRSGPAADPVYPGSPMLGEFAAPPAKPLRYRVPRGVVEVRLMVVALRGNGTVLRKSRIVTIAVPVAVSPSPSAGEVTGSTPDPNPSPSPSPSPQPTPSP